MAEGDINAQKASPFTQFYYGFGSISVGIKNNLLGTFLLATLLLLAALLFFAFLALLASAFAALALLGRHVLCEFVLFDLAVVVRIDLGERLLDAALGFVLFDRAVLVAVMSLQGGGNPVALALLGTLLLGVQRSQEAKAESREGYGVEYLHLGVLDSGEVGVLVPLTGAVT